MKNKTLDLLTKACFILVIAFFSYLIINESIKIIRINTPIEVTDDMKESISDSRKTLESIQKNIQKIDKLDDSVYTEYDKKYIKNTALEFVNEYNKKIEIIDGKDKIT